MSGRRGGRGGDRGRGRGRGEGGRGGDRGRGRGRGRGEGGRGGDRGRGRGGGDPHMGWMTSAVGRARVQDILSAALMTASTVTKFEDLQEGKLAPKPDDGGVVGRPFKIRTNFFALQCTAQNIFQYDIQIAEHGRVLEGGDEAEAEVTLILPAKLNRAIMDLCASNHFPSAFWAFDGQRILYSPEKLIDRDPQIFEIEMGSDGRQKRFDVKISTAAVLQSSDVRRYLDRAHGRNVAVPHSLIAAIEVCLKASFVNDASYIVYGRSIFLTDQPNGKDLPGGSELWQGHFQSVRLTRKGLVLNMDVTYNAFIKAQSVMDCLLSMMHIRNPAELKNLNPRGWKQLGRELSGLLITTTHTRSSKKHKCSGFTKQSADAMMFTKKDGSKQSVAEYWKGKYGQLQYPWMPCVDASKGKKLNFIPVEVCRVAPGQRKGKPTADQTREIISTAARKPDERFQGIRDSFALANFNQNELLKAFKIQVQNQNIEASARLLPQPCLQYSQPECLDTGDRGAWNLQDVKLYQGGTITSWSLVSLVRNTGQLLDGNNGIRSFLNELQKMLRKMGLRIPDAPPPIVDGERMDIKSALAEGAQQARSKFNRPAEIILVLLPSKDAYTYAEVKRSAEGELGLMTQCFVTSTVGIGRPSRGQLQCLANLTIKINLKIGGRNCKLLGSLSEMFPVLGKKMDRPFIVFGADVTHPRTRDTSEQSVGAVVASMDSDLSEFCTRPIFLPHRQETLDMSQAIKDLLLCFRQKNGVSPETIFYYRDGVSDGQFDQVLHHEYNEFQQGFKLLNPKYNPPITFVVVKKRHHLRILPPRNFADRNGNAKPGTVIDRDITSNYDFDFYLNSHAGIQGTNKAAHYYCLLDENGFGSDALQLFTYWSCYLYGRCTRSVSYAPPAYYAHHAAEHGKYLTGFDSDVSSAEGGRPQEPLGLHGNLKNRMYFV